MNRAQKMLEVLRDGQLHSRREIFERAGFMLTNNAAAELRAAGHKVIQHRRRVNGDTVYFYQLFGSLPESPQSPFLSSPSKTSKEDPHGGRGDSGNEQAELFTYPRTPAWE